MKMMLTRTERLALLLHLMGDEATEMARAGLSGEPLEDLDQAIKDFRDYPPNQDEVDLVLDDFENYFQLALQSAQKPNRQTETEEDPADGPKLLQISEEAFDVELEPTKKFERPHLT